MKDEEFATMYDHSPIHHIEYRIKTLESITEKLQRRGFEVTIDNIFTHIQDVAGVRVIWRGLNPRPNRDVLCFLHAYSSLRFRILARPGPPTNTLFSKFLS